MSPQYLCLLVYEYESQAGAGRFLSPEKRTFGHQPFFREGENPRAVLDHLLMASGGIPYIAAVFPQDANVQGKRSFVDIVDVALLAGKFNERAVRDYGLSVEPNKVIVRER